MKKLLLISVCILALATTSPAQTDYTWALGDAGGTWDTTSLNWTNPGTGKVAWPNNTSPADNALFGSVSVTRTVTVSELIHVNKIVFNTASGSWYLSGGTLNFVGAALIDPRNNINYRIYSVITGTNGLTLDTLAGSRGTSYETQLWGSNTYTGVTRIYDSVLAAYHNNALGATGSGNHTYVGLNGRLQIGGSGTSPLTIWEDIQIETMSANAAQGVAIRSADANHILNGNVTFVTGSYAANNDRGFLVPTAHTLTINGNITAVTNGTVNNPRLYFQAAGGPTSKILVNGNITPGPGAYIRLLIDGNSSSPALNGVVELAGDNTFTNEIVIRRGTLLLSSQTAMGGNDSRSGIMIGDGGTGNSGNTNSVLLTGPYTLGRWFQINNAAGTITYTAVLGGNSAHSSVFNGDIAMNATNAGTTLCLTAAAGGTVTFNGLINDGANTKPLTKIGDGTVILARTAGNTYDGGTTVAKGTLLVNNTSGSGTGSGAVTVNAGATLGGTGRIAGDTTVNGTLAPGASPGTLTFDANLTLASTATLAYELNGTDTTVGDGVNDLVIVGGNLTLDGTLNVTETVEGSFMNAKAGDTWRLFNYSGNLTDNVLELGTMPALPDGWYFQLDTSTAGQVNLKVIPEPSATLLIAAGIGLFLLVRRHRR